MGKIFCRVVQQSLSQAHQKASEERSNKVIAWKPWKHGTGLLVTRIVTKHHVLLTVNKHHRLHMRREQAPPCSLDKQMLANPCRLTFHQHTQSKSRMSELSTFQHQATDQNLPRWFVSPARYSSFPFDICPILIAHPFSGNCENHNRQSAQHNGLGGFLRALLHHALALLLRSLLCRQLQGCEAQLP